MYDLTWKVLDLQNECRRLKISYAGRKSDLVKRLNEYSIPIESPETENEENELIDVDVVNYI